MYNRAKLFAQQMKTFEIRVIPCTELIKPL